MKAAILFCAGCHRIKNLMKHLYYIFIAFAAFCALIGCDETFRTWKSLNEEWIVEKRLNLGKGDTDIVDTRILPSGILIEVYHDGFGAIPKPSIDPDTKLSSSILVNFKGYLVDGTEFSSAEKYSMNLANAIEGWQQAMSQMRQGSSWRIIIPSHLGYGEEGTKDGSGNFGVPPHSTLIFDVELLDVINY